MGIGQLRNSTLTLLRGDWQYVARWQAGSCGKYNTLHCKGALKCGMFCAVCIVCTLYSVYCVRIIHYTVYSVHCTVWMFCGQSELTQV